MGLPNTEDHYESQQMNCRKAQISKIAYDAQSRSPKNGAELCYESAATFSTKFYNFHFQKSTASTSTQQNLC